MLRRRFGKTGLEISVLTLGAMRIPPEPGEEPDANRDRALATLRRGLDVGINHIETARGYGASESLIGEALRRGAIRRSEFLLTTKIPPMETADEFRLALDDSMQRMGVDLVDNLDLHGINTAEQLDLAMRAGGCMDAVRRAIDEGIVRHVGFSTHAPLDVILAAIGTGAFESVNLHFYYMNQRNRPAVDLAAASGMGVFIISPTDKGGQLFDPPRRLTDLCAPYTPIQINQRWLLAQPEVHTLSLGAARPEEFDAHLATVGRGGPLEPEEQAIVARLDEARSALGDTYCTGCQACLPCPEDVAIPEILRLRNLAAAYDMVGFGRYRYGTLTRRNPETGERAGGIGHWLPGTQGDFCTDCGDCLPRCPVHLPIPALLRQTHGLLSGEGRRRLWE
ncbi:MAG: aldo/keto reductase [Chthonomonadales bacterium]|nr:aldo/keto reductase [Chthonomonadales bacterium]